MPTIELSLNDLSKLIGKKLEAKNLEKLLTYAKANVEALQKDLIRVEIADTNRPDLWSAEGIAREIRGRIEKKGCPKYRVKKSKVIVQVDPRNSKVRPLTVCAVVRSLRLNQQAISQLIQLQEKICETLGRKRREVALGVYDLDRIKPPIRFTVVKPDGIKFVPLDFKEELTPKQILEQHPKGKEYGHLLANLSLYPIFIDSANQVLSLPPIINSEYTGKVTEKTRNVFIECSGFSFKFLLPALNAIVCALAERGGKIESVKVVYPKKILWTPDLTPKKIEVGLDYIRKISGLALSNQQICKLLREAGYDAKLRGGSVEALYPAYRQDVKHARDLVEDILISYGYENVEPEIPKIYTRGKMNPRNVLVERISKVMISLGFQQILSHTLTNKQSLFEKMNLPERRVVEIENPISERWNVFRNSLLPGLLEFLASNKHVNYPQKIFEVGEVVLLDEKSETRTKDSLRVACCVSDTKVSYEEISSLLDAFLSTLGLSYRLKKTENPSFVEGRVAAILLQEKSSGFVGEVAPKVLEEWKLWMPTVAFELELPENF